MRSFLKTGNGRYNISIILFASITLGILLYLHASAILVQTVEDSLEEIAKQGARIVEKEIKDRLDILEVMSRSDGIKDANIPVESKLNLVQKNFMTNEFLRISIADIYGNSYTTDGKTLYVGDRQYFIRALNGEKNVSDPITSRIDGAINVVFAVPVYSEDKITSVIYATYDAEELSRITDDIKLGNEGNSFIVNKSGTIIAHENRTLVRNAHNNSEEYKAESYKGMHLLQQQMAEGKSGAGEYTYEGEERYMGFTPIKGTDWSIAVTSNKRGLFENITHLLIFFVVAMLAVIFIITIMQIYQINLNKKLKEEKTISGNVIEAANILVVRMDGKGKISDFNRYAELKTGYSRDEVVGKKNMIELLVDEDKNKAGEFVQEFRKGFYVKNMEIAVKTKDGNIINIVWNFNVIGDAYSENQEFEVIGVDITERVISEDKLKESHEQLAILYKELYSSEEKLRMRYDQLTEYQSKLQHLAFNDALTGLPNRLMLNEYCMKYMNNCEGFKYAMMFIDSDNFKIINDTLGHTTGDKLIIRIGERLKLVLGGKGSIFRLGGDEFVIVMPRFTDFNEIEHMARNILEAFKEPFEFDDSRIHTSLSIGIAVYPEHAKGVEELLKRSDIAMYRAKEIGKSSFAVYSLEMEKSLKEKVEIEKHLRSALVCNELYLAYQPQVSTDTGEIIGFEALARWNSAELGSVSPVKFIGIAEDSHLIIPLGEWILRSACVFIKKIHTIGHRRCTISVNISIRQLLQEDFTGMVMEILDDTQLKPEFLELEITESILIESLDLVSQKLEELVHKGITIALDDFGKGYSSLSYLRQLPITTLKIDKSFIDNICEAGRSQTLTNEIISIGRKMGLCVVAEGVETELQLEYLKKSGCERFQGFVFSKPVVENEAIGLLHRIS